MGCCSVHQRFEVPDASPLRTETPTWDNFDIPRLMLKPEQFVQQREVRLESRYAIGSLVGKGTHYAGGYGSVYEATHIPTKANRAVKILSRKGLPEGEFASLLSEVALVRSLVCPTQDHPNILKIHEVLIEEETVNIVAEMYTGCDLLTKTVSMKRLPESLAGKYMKQLLSAVAYCHERLIVHRDLKLENILFESPAPDALIKLIDFGNATKIVPDSPLTFPVGTVASTQAFYAAPEVLAEHYTEKCDIWSCGVILYMMLSGTPPFTGRSEQDLLDTVRRGKFTFPGSYHAAEIWDSVSPAAKELVSLMLTKNPEIRPSAKELLQHCWLQAGDKVVVASHSEEVEILKRLSSFRVPAIQTYGRLRQAVLSYIANQLATTKETEPLRKMFIELDEDQDGRLSTQELANGFAQHSDSSAVDIDRIMRTCDSDKNGFIDYSEFLTATIDWQKVLDDTQVQAAFSAFDEDNNGKVDLDDLKRFLKLSSDDNDSLLLALLADCEGGLDLPNFRRMLMLRHPRKGHAHRSL